MALLGLLLFVVAGAFVGLSIASNLVGGPSYSVTILGNHIATLNGLGIFLAGIALTLIFGLGIALMTGSLARSRHRRQAARTAQADAQSEHPKHHHFRFGH
ncbi:hypothetical protein ACFC0M_21785 [Streptomyces sp. NPDC056149]|uniref:hypothetical protein n=1 Tax=unclassified Streptomyces TaxID=2593676 RepID=UPI002380EB8D|nr:hypothetical protein [Streptomyces sp. WZ-12]